MSSAPRTLAEKVWDDHVVRRPARASQTCSTSTCTWSTRSPARRPSTGCAPPAATVRRPDLTIATEDHNVPTTGIGLPIADPIPPRRRSRRCARTAAEFGIRLYPMGDAEQGIVHVIGPQLGLTQPGMTIVCGDSPHLHARRVRRAGVRHRHQRGRARAGHADAAADQAQDDGDHRRGRAARRRDRQGPDPRAHRPDRHRRRPGLRASSTAARRSGRCPWKAG